MLGGGIIVLLWALPQMCQLTCRLAGLDLTLNCRYEMSAQKLVVGGGGLAPLATPDSYTHGDYIIMGDHHHDVARSYSPQYMVLAGY